LSFQWVFHVLQVRQTRIESLGDREEKMWRRSSCGTSAAIKSLAGQSLLLKTSPYNEVAGGTKFFSQTASFSYFSFWFMLFSLLALPHHKASGAWTIFIFQIESQ